MRLALVFGLVLACTGSLAVGEEPAGGGVDLASVTAVVATAEGHLADIDALITAQEARLDALYTQRDAATEAGDRDRAAQLGMVIDRFNLILTNLEAERDSIATMVAGLHEQIAALDATQPPQPED